MWCAQGIYNVERNDELAVAKYNVRKDIFDRIFRPKWDRHQVCRRTITEQVFCSFVINGRTISEVSKHERTIKKALSIRLFGEHI